MEVSRNMPTVESRDTMNKNVLPLVDASQFQLDRRLPGEHLKRFAPETVFAMQTALSVGHVFRTIDVTEGVETKTEGVLNRVTAWDRASGEIIRRELKTHFPNDPVLSEEVVEKPENLLSQPRLWVGDELDGTFNASQMISYYAVSIGFVRSGQPWSGAIYFPPVDQLYYGEVGVGTFSDGWPAKRYVGEKLSEVSITTNAAYKTVDFHKHLDLLRVTGSPRGTVCGATVLSLAEVALGRHALGFSLESKPWDKAAAQALVTAAGLDIRGVDGRPNPSILEGDIVVGDKRFIDQFIPLAQPLLKEWGFAPKKSL